MTKPKFGDVLTSKASGAKVMYIGPSAVKEQAAYISGMCLFEAHYSGSLRPTIKVGDIQNYRRAAFNA